MGPPEAGHARAYFVGQLHTPAPVAPKSDARTAAPARTRRGPERPGLRDNLRPTLDIFIQELHNHAMTDKPRRHRLILDLVAQGGVANQDSLATLLKKRGLRVTQATLSRDLHELAVVKGPGGYSLPAPSNGANGASVRAVAEPGRGLERALREFLLSAATGGNLAILHTGPGRAPLLALEIDRASIKPILGTVAGDDTVFIATRSPRDAAKLLAPHNTLAGLN